MYLCHGVLHNEFAMCAHKSCIGRNRDRYMWRPIKSIPANVILISILIPSTPPSIFYNHCESF